MLKIMEEIFTGTMKRFMGPEEKATSVDESKNTGQQFSFTKVFYCLCARKTEILSAILHPPVTDRVKPTWSVISPTQVPLVRGIFLERSW